jgi:hopanoid biosynthesis associated RND transporter like protein HpnN
MAREEHSHDGRLARFLAGWVAWVCSYPWVILSVSLLSVGLSLYYTCSRLQYLTQRDDLLSPHKDYYRRWQQYVAEFGSEDDMVVVVQGQDREQMKQAIEALAARIQLQPNRFDRLFYKVDLRPLKNRALLFLSCEQLQQIQENLKNMTLLLDTPVLPVFDALASWKLLTLDQLLREGERRLGALQWETSGTGSDLEFLTQLGGIVRTAAAVLDDPAAYRNPWQSIIRQPPDQKDMMAEPQYFFSGDGSLAFLLVRPAREDSFTGADKSVNSLRQVLQELRPIHPGVTLGLTGLPVLEDDEMVASERDSNRASWLALVGVALLYVVVYRCWRYPLFTVAALLTGTAWSLGWTTLTVGHLNILSSAFAVMLIGMGDYGVLWVTRYCQERHGGADLFAAMRRTAATVGPGILTAAVTTALAFFATMLADFKAIIELGWIAGCGILLCALACFIVMPALMTLCERRFGKYAAPSATVSLAEAREDRREWLPSLMHRPRMVIMASLAMTMVFGLFALGTHYDHNLLHMQAGDLESVQWEETLIDKTAGASWHALSYTTTPEECLALKAQFEKLPEVSRVVEAASLVPRDQEHKLVQLRDIQFRLRKLPRRGAVIPHGLPRVEEYQRTLSRMLEDRRLKETGRNKDLAESLRSAFLTLKKKLAAANTAIAAARLKNFEEQMTGDLAEDLHRLRDVSTPAPIRVTDLPPSFRERYIGKTGKWLLSVFAKDSLWEYQPLANFIAKVQTVDPEATGKPFTTLEGLRAMKNAFLVAAVYAAMAMVVVLLLDFRSWKCTLVAVAPVVMGLCLTCGAMTLLGIPFNPANMIALPLILGVGMDNGVHVLHDFRSRNKRPYCLGRATGRGIMVAALTTILGFGTLMISSHRGIASLGLALSLGVSFCMFSALISLPAFLSFISSRRDQAAAVQPVRRAA